MDETRDKNESLPEVGPWAQEKLEGLRKYLSEYTKIMANQRWAEGYVYIDAFAGSGRTRVREASPAQSSTLPFLNREFTEDEDARQIIDGSPRVALDIEPPFTRYVFVERDPRRVLLLESLVQEYKSRQILIRKKDCNDYLGETIAKVDWRKWRAVVFLDPFGMQVPWETIASLARTKAIEIFLNFPIGMAIQRLLRKDGRFTDKERQKLDLYFGDPGWFDATYPKSQGLFETEPRKAEDAERRLLDWYRERLKTSFGYVSEARLVTNTRGGHLYFLVFAGPNKTGARIANYVLQSGIKQRARR